MLRSGTVCPLHVSFHFQAEKLQAFSGGGAGLRELYLQTRGAPGLASLWE